MPLVVNQLETLWSGEMVRCLFRDLVNLIPSDGAGISSSTSKDLGIPVKNLLKRINILSKSIGVIQNYYSYEYDDQLIL